MRQCIAALSLVVLVSGCALAPTHDSQVATSLAAAGQGNVSEAIREREAVIAEFRAKETAAAEQEAKDKGVTGEAKELNGYPIETLNDPEVLQLKNGFQNSLSHYLAGFVYEALNEPSLSAPGYRKAIELRPGVSLLEEGLRGLDQRTS